MECNACGRDNHVEAACRLKVFHPDVNKDPNVRFADSEVGQKWAAINDDQGNPYNVVPYHRTLSGDRPQPANSNNNQGNSRKPANNKFNNNNKGKFPLLFMTNDDYSHNRNDPMIPVRLSRKEQPQLKLEADMVLDMGAFYDNFVSVKLVNEYKDKLSVCRSCHECLNNLILHIKPVTISGFNTSQCTVCSTTINFDITFINEYKEEVNLSDITFKIIQCDYDIILGRLTIRKHALYVKHFPSMIVEDQKAWLHAPRIPFFPEDTTEETVTSKHAELVISPAPIQAFNPNNSHAAVSKEPSKLLLVGTGSGTYYQDKRTTLGNITRRGECSTLQ
jgi:hypothetical protein